MTAQILFRAARLMQVCVPKDTGSTEVIAYASAGQAEAPRWHISNSPFNFSPCTLHAGNVHIALEA